MDSMLQLALAAAFLAGLTGGVHCAAMCGPLVGIACGPRGLAAGGSGWISRAVAYNTGRIASYSIAGALAAALGAARLSVRGGPAVQQLMLAAMRASLIVLAGYIAGIAPLARALETAGGVLWRRIEPQARRFLPVTTPARAFGLGLVWGWLPCGMVYVALVSALATADPALGALLMAAFGLGTLPNLLAIFASVRHFHRFVRGRVARVLAGAAIAAIGVAGLAKAMQPAAVLADGSLCLQIPGILAILQGGI